MSHVAEGELTAYADGAYASADAAAQRIKAHLAVCTNCRNRLLQAQALTGRAAEILAMASPDVGALPSFAELSNRSATRPRVKRRIPLAWAASILLAVGLGWFGRDALNQDQPEVASTSERGRATAPDPAAPANAAAEAPLTAAAQTRPAPSSATRMLKPRAPSSSADEPARTVAGAAAGNVASAEMSAPSASPPAAAKAVAPARRAAADMIEESSRSGIQYMTAAEAERRKLTVHVVPELEVLRIGIRNDETVVEQKLPDGKILTLTARAGFINQDQMDKRRAAGAFAQERKAAVAPQAAPAEPLPGVTVLRGSTRVSVWAMLPADSLRALAAKVR